MKNQCSRTTSLALRGIVLELCASAIADKFVAVLRALPVLFFFFFVLLRTRHRCTFRDNKSVKCPKHRRRPCLATGNESKGKGRKENQGDRKKSVNRKRVKMSDSRGGATASPTERKNASEKDASEATSRQKEGKSGSERIIVAVRLRPALPGESKDIAEHSYNLENGPPDGPADRNRLLYSASNKSIAARKVYDVSSHTYCFDAFFGPSATNEQVFSSAAKQIVGAALQGFNGTVFAFGMTGSGKTYTMMGQQSDPGIIPQSFAHIFASIHEHDEEVEVRLSYMELYCERLRDLLQPHSGDQNLQIREDAQVGVFVPNATTQTVTTWEECQRVLDIGQSHRAMTATKMNEESSRSHAVLMAKIKVGNTAAKLFLVDLAGSERVGKSGVTGQGLDEAKAINLSLSALGNCIKALIDKSNPHVPFRSSKLTRLLQDSLGGNSRTSLIVAVRPGVAHVDETVAALQFGSRAMKVTVNARKNVVSNWKNECLKLQSKLETANNRVAKLEGKVIKMRSRLDRHRLSISEKGDIGVEEMTSSSSESEDEHIDKRKSSQTRRRSLAKAMADKAQRKLRLSAMQAKLKQTMELATKGKDDLEATRALLEEEKKYADELKELLSTAQNDLMAREIEVGTLQSKVEEADARQMATMKKLADKEQEHGAQMRVLQSELEEEEKRHMQTQSLLRSLESEMMRTQIEAQSLRDALHETQERLADTEKSMRAKMKDVQKVAASESRAQKRALRDAERITVVKSQEIRNLSDLLLSAELEAKETKAALREAVHEQHAWQEEVKAREEAERQSMNDLKAKYSRVSGLVRHLRQGLMKTHLEILGSPNRYLQRLDVDSLDEESSSEVLMDAFLELVTRMRKRQERLTSSEIAKMEEAHGIASKNLHRRIEQLKKEKSDREERMHYALQLLHKITS